MIRTRVAPNKLERLLDGVQLPAHSPDPMQQLSFVFGGVGHSVQPQFTSPQYTPGGYMLKRAGSQFCRRWQFGQMRGVILVRFALEHLIRNRNHSKSVWHIGLERPERTERGMLLAGKTCRGHLIQGYFLADMLDVNIFEIEKSTVCECWLCENEPVESPRGTKAGYNAKLGQSRYSQAIGYQAEGWLSG